MTKYGYATTIVQATNGFLVKVGCSLFIKEGTIEDLTPLLARYFNLDPSLPQEYGRNENNPFFSNELQVAAPCYGESPKELHAVPAKNWLARESHPASVTIYQAKNGTITVNHETDEVILKEDKKG